MIMPVCDSVNGMNTPTAYNGINRSVDPWKIVINAADPSARVRIPLNNPTDPHDPGTYAA